MNIRKATVLGFIVSLFLLIPGIASAAGGGKEVPIVIVSDTRFLGETMAWWGNLYNESHLYFTIFTVIIIPVVGIILGLLADLVMLKIGIDLNSRELAED